MKGFEEESGIASNRAESEKMTISIAGQDYADRSAFEKHMHALRRMTGEQRLMLALELWRAACEMTRAGIRVQHSEFSAEEIERELARRIMIGNGSARTFAPNRHDS